MLTSLFGASCSRAESKLVDFKTFPDATEDQARGADAAPQKVVLAGGCFWCTEGVFEQIPGVLNVVSGYAGDVKTNADYGKVSNRETKHAEAIEITYDASKISLSVISIVSDDTNPLFLRAAEGLTADGGGQFFSASDPKEIPALVSAEVAIGCCQTED